MNRLLRLALFGCTLAAAALLSRAPILRAEADKPQPRRWDFESDEIGKIASGFKPAVGTWSVVADGKNHVLEQSARSDDAIFNLVLVDDTSYANLELAVKLKAVGGKVDQGGGVVWRARDPRNYYVARFNPLEDNFRAYKVVDGKRTQLESAKVTGGAAQWRLLKITMRGSHIKCFLDDKLYLEAADATFPGAGKIGLWCKSDANTYFDDLTVADGTVAAALPAQPHPVIRMLERLPGLSNIVQAGTGIYSGSEPFGEEGFSSLARMGIRTVISVDGAKPNGDEAHRHGMQYIHIPIGYDGVHERARLAFVRVAREVDRPIYVHCHHGQHRGPAATAIVCIAADGLDAGDALSILKTAGTGKEYAGLWRDVANFSLPATDAAIPELHEVAQVKSLTAAMAGLDRHWDNLKLCRDAGWETPRDHPDLSPAREALLLREALHEARRTAPTDTLDDRFREWLQAAEVLAVRIEEELKEGKPDDASRRIQILEQSCKTCHAKYRN